MNENAITCVSDCLVVVRHEFALPILNLSMVEAAEISSAILLVWAVGFGIRVLIQTLKNSDGNNPDKET